MSRYIKVRVKPGERKEIIIKKNSDSYVVSVKEKPENNMANRRVCEVFASLCDVPLKNVKIISGHHKSSKLLLINN